MNPLLLLLLMLAGMLGFSGWEIWKKWQLEKKISLSKKSAQKRIDDAFQKLIDDLDAQQRRYRVHHFRNKLHTKILATIKTEDGEFEICTFDIAGLKGNIGFIGPLKKESEDVHYWLAMNGSLQFRSNDKVHPKLIAEMNRAWKLMAWS